MVRRLLLATVVASLAALAVGCGPDEPEGPDLSRFAAPPTATR
ncbi:MAG TPA: hypothetical protein VNP92_06730 [Actinophytocola sp.]|nr:hypothetical protein [Actinophytocola sp.]